ncbi:hypothetical protein B9Z65_3122 [Elsinoe australis]|uniref:Beta-xylosidase C-terminal Concanavalin A-like domain-containing protein n=1 Tax=Elsinoe australis TaxID=40998 RepID=A0A2P7ZUF5_9PEZI|nr:hypothetical protein B9Z65_3122 [Elsinoe australis]
MQYHNPIIPGFAPDPSCIFVNDVYFLVNSSFHVFPGLPVYASRDLQNWTHIGNAINRPDQLSLENAIIEQFPIGRKSTLYAALGLVAPTIRHYDGKFYVVCTNITTSDEGLIYSNFYVSATDPWTAAWSDPIFFDFNATDTSLFFDDDGRAYIQGSHKGGPSWNPKCTIHQLEISIEDGTIKVPSQEIWRGHTDQEDAEGPHVYKKDGYYYLVITEAGAFEHHMITIARAENVHGPYTSFPLNPVLKAQDTGSVIQNTGHGDIFQGRYGQWWCVYIGVRDLDGRYPLGRETFLSPVTWVEGQWPVIEQPRASFKRSMPYVPITKRPSSPTLECDPTADNVYIRTPRLQDYSLKRRKVSLMPDKTDLSCVTGTTSFVGRRQRSLHCDAVVSFAAQQPMPSETKLSLSVYKDNFRYLSVEYDMDKSAVSLKVKFGSRDLHTPISYTIKDADIITLQICARPEAFYFFYRASSLAQRWEMLGSVDTRDFTNLDFTGPIIGVGATSQQNQGKTFVTFHDFNITVDRDGLLG